MTDELVPRKPGGEELVPFFIGARGSLPLAAERATRALKVKVTEYDLVEALTGDETVAENAAMRLRSLLVISMFDMIMQFQIAVGASIEDMRPADLSRTFTALISSFTTLTQPTPKSALDLLAIATRTAEELDLSPAAVLKDMEQLLSSNPSSGKK